MIRIGREIQCLPYAGFLFVDVYCICATFRIAQDIQCLRYAGFFKPHFKAKKVPQNCWILVIPPPLHWKLSKQKKKKFLKLFRLWSTPSPLHRKCPNSSTKVPQIAPHKNVQT